MNAIPLTLSKTVFESMNKHCPRDIPIALSSGLRSSPEIAKVIEDIPGGKRVVECSTCYVIMSFGSGEFIHPIKSKIMRLYAKNRFKIFFFLSPLFEVLASLIIQKLVITKKLASSKCL